jgi:hypothetical protein
LVRHVASPAAADLPVARTLRGTTCTQYGHEAA